MSVSETRAARALVAYFNHDLAKQLVARVLKERSKEVWEELSGKILNLVPEAAKQHVWEAVLASTRKLAEDFIRTPGFTDRAKKMVENQANHFVTQAVEREVQERVRAHVASVMKTYPMSDYLKNVPGRLQSEIERETTKAAQDRVRDAG